MRILYVTFRKGYMQFVLYLIHLQERLHAICVISHTSSKKSLGKGKLLAIIPEYIRNNIVTDIIQSRGTAALILEACHLFYSLYNFYIYLNESNK